MNLWQTQQFQRLWQAKLANRLSHALLLVGVKGTNKAKFADYFARTLLCEQVTNQGEACHQCHRCRLITGRVHPNLLWVEPEKDSKVIKIDQIRAITDFANQTSLQGEHRIIIVHTADDMNLNAANALLKTLEEPSAGSLLILISDQLGHLPATIISRCQRIIFPSPDRTQTLAWMTSHPARQNLFQTLILLAEKKGDPIKSAAELQSNDPIELLDFLLSWIVDLLRLQLNSESDRVTNLDYTEQLMQLRQKTQLTHNVTLMDEIQRLRAQLSDGINLNKQMVLESIFIRWVESVACFS